MTFCESYLGTMSFKLHCVCGGLVTLSFPLMMQVTSNLHHRQNKCPCQGNNAGIGTLYIVYYLVPIVMVLIYIGSSHCWAGMSTSGQADTMAVQTKLPFMQMSCWSKTSMLLNACKCWHPRQCCVTQGVAHLWMIGQIIILMSKDVHWNHLFL